MTRLPGRMMVTSPCVGVEPRGDGQLRCKQQDDHDIQLVVPNTYTASFRLRSPFPSNAISTRTSLLPFSVCAIPVQYGSDSKGKTGNN